MLSNLKYRIISFIIVFKYHSHLIRFGNYTLVIVELNNILGGGRNKDMHSYYALGIQILYYIII